MSLADFNFVLFHCQEEEKEAGCGGIYNVPGYGDLTYAGLHGRVRANAFEKKCCIWCGEWLRVTTYDVSHLEGVSLVILAFRIY